MSGASGQRALVDPRLGNDLEAIRQWRILWSLTGLPSGLDDCLRFNGVCLGCRGRGRTTFGADRCDRCDSTGRAGLVETMVYQRNQLSQLEKEGGGGDGGE
jgi:hypothetical protein